MLTLLRGALIALTGGAIGFVLGGPGGALLGGMRSLGVFAGLQAMDFLTERDLGNQILGNLTRAISIAGGALIGFKLGGPLGALFGAMLGLGINFV